MILRSRPFRHWLARLALAAVLLLALAPTVSRWVQSSGQRLPGVLLAMCTSDGLSLVTPASVWTDVQADQGERAPVGAAQDEYCPHCPLLAKITPLLLAALVLPALRAPPPSADAHASVLRIRAIARGLGARGPPLPL
jgi:hypothetical protein